MGYKSYDIPTLFKNYLTERLLLKLFCLPLGLLDGFYI